MTEREGQYWFNLEPNENKIVISKLDGYFHRDKFGRLQDVRLIEPRYAYNLYNWYLRRNYMPEEEMTKTTLMKELENRIRYENF